LRVNCKAQWVAPFLLALVSIAASAPTIHAYSGDQLNCPALSQPVTIDGKWTYDAEWSDASVATFSTFYQSTNRATAYLYAKHDSSNFYFLIDFVSATSLDTLDDYASITIDPLHNDGNYTTTMDDRRFDSQYPTGGKMGIGTGAAHFNYGFSSSLPQGVKIAMSMGSSENLAQPQEITEFRIPYSTFSQLMTTVGFTAAVSHGGAFGFDYTAGVWPAGALATAPVTWGELTLSPAQIPEFAPFTAVVIMSLLVTLSVLQHDRKKPRFPPNEKEPANDNRERRNYGASQWDRSGAKAYFM